jgi:hypothetical protein
LIIPWTNLPVSWEPASWVSLVVMIKGEISGFEAPVRCEFQTKIGWVYEQGERRSIESAVAVLLTADQKSWLGDRLCASIGYSGKGRKLWRSGSLVIWSAKRLSVQAGENVENWA